MRPVLVDGFVRFWRDFCVSCFRSRVSSRKGIDFLGQWVIELIIGGLVREKYDF